MKYLLQRNYYTDNVYRGYFPRHACLILEGEGRRKERDRYKFVERFADFLREFSLPIFSRASVGSELKLNLSIDISPKRKPNFLCFSQSRSLFEKLAPLPRRDGFFRRMRMTGGAF